MTIGVCLRRRKEKTPDLTALQYDGMVYTWKQLYDLSAIAAAIYRKKGIRKGMHVALWSANSPYWLVCYLALARIGAVSVLININYKQQELKQILAYADVTHICIGDGYKDLDYGVLTEDLAIPVISIGKSEKGWFADLEQEPAGAMTGQDILVSGDDPASMLFTSGTTNTPKGVVLTHRQLTGVAAETVRQMRWQEEDRMCMSMPLFHCFGLSAGFLASIQSGCAMYMTADFRTGEIMRNIQENQCTVLNGVPTLFLALLKNPDRKACNLSSLKSGIIAGSPVSADIYIKISQELGMTYLQQSYGQTETSPSVTFTDFDSYPEQKAMSTGKAIAGVRLRIRELPGKQGAAGEIMVKGYNVMQGYYKLSAGEYQPFDAEGWLHTGDLGYLDEEENLHVTGRLNEIIIRSGENISPAEIESCISRFDGVEQVKVLGIPAPVVQEEIAACLIMKPGRQLDEPGLRRYLHTAIAAYKVPRYLFQLDQFPVTASGKLRVCDLKKIIQNKIDK